MKIDRYRKNRFSLLANQWKATESRTVAAHHCSPLKYWFMQPLLLSLIYHLIGLLRYCLGVLAVARPKNLFFFNHPFLICFFFSLISIYETINRQHLKYGILKDIRFDFKGICLHYIWLGSSDHVELTELNPANVNRKKSCHSQQLQLSQAYRS